MDASCIVAEDGLIRSIQADNRTDGADVVLDAGGATVAPGLIDSHCHVVLGDYTPRQRTVGFLESYLHGGITRCISPGELHAPGRPRDREGVKSLAITANHSFENIRPGGMRVHGGCVVLEPTLEEGDFQDLADEGVWLAKVGFGDFDHPNEYAPYVRAAQEQGIMVMVHTGGSSIPGSVAIGADELFEIQPDICGHVNGGPTALSEDENKRLVEESDFLLQLVQAGNLRSSLHLLDCAEQAGELDRVIIGTDTPTGTGVIPLGMLKTMAELSSLSGLPAERILRMATGQIADHYDLNAGVIEEGRAADLVVLDAPQGSQAGSALESLSIGDVPAVASVVTDGEVRFVKSRNTPPARCDVAVTRYEGNPYRVEGGH